MFEQFEMRDRAMIYQGLLCLVRSNSGVGFCNGDQGHPAYASLAKTESMTTRRLVTLLSTIDCSR